MPEDLESVDDEPELTRASLDPMTERRIEELTAELTDYEPEAVKEIIRCLLAEAVVVVPVANLSPDAEARRNLSRFASLPPPPEVPGVTISSEDAPPAVVAQTAGLGDGDAATLGAWADSGVPLLPASTSEDDDAP